MEDEEEEVGAVDDDDLDVRFAGFGGITLLLLVP